MSKCRTIAPDFAFLAGHALSLHTYATLRASASHANRTTHIRTDASTARLGTEFVRLHRASACALWNRPHEMKRSTSHATCIHPFSLTQPYTCLLRAHVTPAPLGSLPPGPPHYHQPTKSVQSSNATCAEVAAVRCAIHAHAASARALAHIRQSASMCPPCMSTCISTAMSRSPLSMSRRPLGRPCASPRSSSLACSSLADGSP